MKILLIDNHVLFCEGLRPILCQLPGAVSEIWEARSLSEGLALAERHPDLDLVLLELKSPGCEYSNSVKVFHQQNPHMKIMVLSSEEDCRVIKEAMSHGADGYVSKSSNGTILLRALGLVLAGSTYIPPQLFLPQAIALRNNNNGIDRRRSTSKEFGLTSRQRDVLSYLANGLSNKEISQAMNLAEGTIKVHIAAMFQTLGVRKRLEAVQVAKQRGLAGTSCA